MHDMAAFTGGCHYAGDCDRYTGQCGKCPQISSGKILDRATRIQNERLNFSKSLKPTIVAPSRWIASVSKSSAVFSQSSVRIIPNGFDTDLLRPYGQAIARAHFGLTPSSLLVAFGAIGGTADPRKGADLLNAALEVLKIRGVRQVEKHLWKLYLPVIELSCFLISMT
jgi:glycosyltransferase involved in cell wall biosynthesis